MKIDFVPGTRADPSAVRRGILLNSPHFPSEGFLTVALDLSVMDGLSFSILAA